jgi:transcriptional regulator with XRE-family HTH domain
MLGLTQQQLAEMIGVTYQQAHKYERGINRVSAGRLFEITTAAVWWVQGFAEEEDVSFKKIVADYEKESHPGH